METASVQINPTGTLERRFRLADLKNDNKAG
jgi:hypothetical protein